MIRYKFYILLPELNDALADMPQQGDMHPGLRAAREKHNKAVAAKLAKEAERMEEDSAEPPTGYNSEEDAPPAQDDVGGAIAVEARFLKLEELNTMVGNRPPAIEDIVGWVRKSVPSAFLLSRLSTGKMVYLLSDVICVSCYWMRGELLKKVLVDMYNDGVGDTCPITRVERKSEFACYPSFS